MSGLLQVHPVAQYLPHFLSSLCVSPAPSWKWTEDDTNKKGLPSAVFDNLSLRGSLIIHASLTGYLLSFCISLLKTMRKVEGYVAIINFPLTQHWHLFIKLNRITFNKANFLTLKQARGSQYFERVPASYRFTLFITASWQKIVHNSLWCCK